MGTQNEAGGAVSTPSQPIRLLIHPQQDQARYIAITERLIQATREHPETFDVVVGVPNVGDHVGYHDSMRSSVVFADEYGTAYKRLTLRPDLHPVFADLLKLATA